MLQNMIDPEWYDVTKTVAKAVCYLLGAGCSFLCMRLGYKSGYRAGREDGRRDAAREWLERFRRYALGCDRLDIMSEAAVSAGKDGVKVRLEKCPVCGEPRIVYTDPCDPMNNLTDNGGKDGHQHQ